MKYQEFIKQNEIRDNLYRLILDFRHKNLLSWRKLIEEMIAIASYILERHPDELDVPPSEITPYPRRLVFRQEWLETNGDPFTAEDEPPIEIVEND